MVGHCASQDPVEELFVDLECFLHIGNDLIELLVFLFEICDSEPKPLHLICLLLLCLSSFSFPFVFNALERSLDFCEVDIRD